MEKTKNRGRLNADCCDLCTTQTPLRLNHRESSTLFCQISDTTFSCRWATSSPPSCSWPSSSSLSSSSHADIKPKVWPAVPQSDDMWCTLNLRFWTSSNFSCVFRVLSACIHEVSENPQTHTHNHCLTLKHTLTVCYCDRSSRSQSSSEEFEMDVAEGNVCSREERRFGECQ